MFKKKKQVNPEDPNELAKLVPLRRYTREEVDQGMEWLIGMVNDGLRMNGYTVKEMPKWFEVQVTYDDPYDKDTAITYETWYFFKP